MVDVTHKAWTRRRAVARGKVVGHVATLLRPGSEGTDDLNAILATARAAGIEAARKTAELIPLCHPLPASQLDVRFDVRPSGITVETCAEVVAPTGVEMEALTACMFAALVVASAFGPNEEVSIEDVALWAKSGGRSGIWSREQALPVR